MRPNPIEIAFGDQKFTIKPLTLGQVRDIEKALLAPGQASTELAIAVIGIALRRDHSDTMAEDLEGGPEEMSAALKAILALGGFKTAAPGEGEGAPTPNATGE